MKTIIILKNGKFKNLTYIEDFHVLVLFIWLHSIYSSSQHVMNNL